MKKSCSSQEEHVLKLYCIFQETGESRCSSQEEHVLKPCETVDNVSELVLLLARGACIETESTSADEPAEKVAPRKRSMY